ncbi:protein BCCIP homolog [Impatiens glandulifera]|uniref:protein BCCIP homolog n=1 Tax=Impatiens glandulifera TaxID=253017 RepID=UPI001FB172BB|nr:protein BCCIP homolog [Impatiens glandulifera]
MPRKPARCQRRLLIRKPVTFSPFSRMISQVTSGFKIRHQNNQSLNHGRVSSPHSTGNELENNDSEDNIGQSESSDEEFDGVIQADFVFFDPKPDDFHGVKILLQPYLDVKQWDLSGFVDLIIAQTTVGTVIKIENDEDNALYSVITALNLGRYKGNRCFTEIREFLLKVCQDKDSRQSLLLLLEQEANVGLLVSQRVVNLQPQLLPHMYDSLFDEISWATEDEPTEELRKAFCFRYYLIITKIYEHKNVNQKNGADKKGEESIIYVKPEDEIFHELASWSFTFSMNTQQLTTRELRDYRIKGLVMAVEAEKVPEFRQQLHSLIEE